MISRVFKPIWVRVAVCMLAVAAFAAAFALAFLSPTVRWNVLGIDDRIEWKGNLGELKLGSRAVLIVTDEGLAAVYIDAAQALPSRSCRYRVHEQLAAVSYDVYTNAKSRPLTQYAIVDGEQGTLTKFEGDVAAMKKVWKGLTGAELPLNF